MSADLMETAKMLLAVYCRKQGIDDAECQRIADRINREHDEKNHLRNPKPLKSQTEVIASAIRRAQRVIDAAAEQILLEGK